MSTDPKAVPHFTDTEGQIHIASDILDLTKTEVVYLVACEDCPYQSPAPDGFLSARKLAAAHLIARATEPTIQDPVCQRQPNLKHRAFVIESHKVTLK